MLRVPLRTLTRGPVETADVVPLDDPLLQDLGFELAEPLQVRGRLSDSGPGRYYWDGELDARVAMSCRRCLAAVEVPVHVKVGALFTDESAADDPETYVIPPRAAEVALGDMVREELLIAVPDYVLCRDDCRGLCVQCGKDLNEGPCSCRPAPDPRWAALETLRDQRSDEEK